MALPPLLASGQVVYTATLVNSGSNIGWQDAANWNITPAGGPGGFPNNVPGTASYEVTIPQSQTMHLDANVHISSLAVNGDLTFQNGGAHLFRVDGDFNLQAGTTLNTQVGIGFVLNGSSQLLGSLQLSNGANLANFGTLFAGDAAASHHFIADPAHGVNYDFANAGTTTLARAGGITFQNFSVLNVGTLEIQKGMVSAAQYTQDSGVTRISNGATLSVNGLYLNGGTVFGEGDGLTGSSFSFGAATLEIGSSTKTAATLNITGNAGSFSGATFQFDLGGTGANQFDLLKLPGGSFNGVNLGVRLINGFQNSIKPTDSFTIITGQNLGGAFANQAGNKLHVNGVGDFDILVGNSSVVLNNFVPSPVPEPEQVALAAGVALLGFGGWRRWRA